jgi:DNA-binding beta-propeller fold protein YncE
MAKTIIRIVTHIRNSAVCVSLFLLLLAVAAAGQELRHVRTYGSAAGIHPPGILHRKVARAALGDPVNPYGLLYPVAVTTDLQRRVWITDSGTRSVHVFAPDGSYREIRRLPDVQFDQPTGIASDSQGRVYVADTGTGAILVFDERGGYDRQMVHPGGLRSPSAIALSEDGRTIFVADPPQNAVVALNREGEVTGTIPLPDKFGAPSSLAVIHNQVYVLSAGRRQASIFSPGGRLRGTMEWEGVSLPMAFAFDPVRHLFLVANPRWVVVQLFDEDGRNVGVFGCQGDEVDQMQSIGSLYIDREGLVYVVDSRHGKVLVFGEAKH